MAGDIVQSSMANDHAYKMKPQLKLGNKEARDLAGWKTCKSTCQEGGTPEEDMETQHQITMLYASLPTGCP